MKISPIAGPLPIQPSIDKPAATAVREKVIAMMTGQAPAGQETAVQNPSQVSPEEMTAVKAPSERQSDPTLETESQEVTPEKPKVDPDAQRRYVQLARQEQALRAKAHKQEQAIRAREEALAAREANLTAPSQPQGYSKDQIKANALDILAEAGVSYEELTQQILTQQPRDPRLNAEMQALRDEIKALRGENEKTVKGIEEQNRETRTAALRQIKFDAIKLVQADPEFETIRATNSINDVVELIEKSAMEDGIILSVEEACAEVEQYLLDQLMPLTKIEKIQKRLQAGQPKAQVEQPKTQAAGTPGQQQQPMKTLTNANSSSRQLSARERALLAFKGELKS